MPEPKEPKDREIKIKRCDGGWIMSERGQRDKLLTRWQSVVWELEERLFGPHPPHYIPPGPSF